MNDRISSGDDNENEEEEFLSSKNIDDISIDKYAHLKRRDSDEDQEEDLHADDESIQDKFSDQDSSDSGDSSEEDSNLDEIRIISFIKSRLR